MKKMLRMGERKRALQVWSTAEVHAEPQEPPALVDSSVPERETPPVQSELPTWSELEKRVEEAERLGEVGRSLESLPTWQLAQIGVEAGPFISGGEKPVRRKLWPTVGGNSPQEGIPKCW